MYLVLLNSLLKKKIHSSFMVQKTFAPIVLNTFMLPKLFIIFYVLSDILSFLLLNYCLFIIEQINIFILYKLFYFITFSSLKCISIYYFYF